MLSGQKVANSRKWDSYFGAVSKGGLLMILYDSMVL